MKLTSFREEEEHITKQFKLQSIEFESYTLDCVKLTLLMILQKL